MRNDRHNLDFPGRVFAWAYGGLLIVPGVATIVSVGIPPTEPVLAQLDANVRQIWPKGYINFLLFMAAFVCLIVIAATLTESIGRNVRNELIRSDRQLAASSCQL